MNYSRMRGPIFGAVAAIALSGFYLLPQGAPHGTARARTPRLNRPVVSHTRVRSSNDGAYVNVTITAMSAVVNVDPNTAPSSDIHIADLSNAGPAVDDFFGMKPREQARYQLFASTQMDPTHNATMWKLIEIDAATGAKTMVKTGWINDCKHGVPPTKADADFFSCDRSAQFHTNLRHRINRTLNKSVKIKTSEMMSGFFLDRIVALIQAVRDTTDRDPSDPPWISCTTGCCTLEQ